MNFTTQNLFFFLNMVLNEIFFFFHIFSWAKEEVADLGVRKILKLFVPIAWRMGYSLKIQNFHQLIHHFNSHDEWIAMLNG